MTKRFLSICLLMAVCIFLSNCKTSLNTPIPNTQKTSLNAPFKETIVPSQFFEIKGDKDNVLEGEQGTVMVFPKGCFLNTKGEIVEENISIELAEAFSLTDILLSNLTTTSNGK